MADSPSIDVTEFLGKHLATASTDLLREMVDTFAQAVKGADADGVCGALPKPERGRLRRLPPAESPRPARGVLRLLEQPMSPRSVDGSRPPARLCQRCGDNPIEFPHAGTCAVCQLDDDVADGRVAATSVFGCFDSDDFDEDVTTSPPE